VKDAEKAAWHADGGRKVGVLLSRMDEIDFYASQSKAKDKDAKLFREIVKLRRFLSEMEKGPEPLSLVGDVKKHFGL